MFYKSSIYQSQAEKNYKQIYIYIVKTSNQEIQILPSKTLVEFKLLM